MGKNNTPLNEAKNACFDVVMQLMTAEEFIKKAFQFSMSDAELNTQEIAIEKAHKSLSILLGYQDLEKISKKQTACYISVLKKIVDE